MEFEFLEPGKILGRLLRFILISLVGLISTGIIGEMVIEFKGGSRIHMS